MSNSKSPEEYLQLAQSAAVGDQQARARVNDLVHPLIDYHSNRYCKRFCYENSRLYRCSLSKPLPAPSAEALLCEWGNASYGWMLDDLTSENRLNRYSAKNGASLFDYLYQIANSLPFYERWKDWRFGRRVHVPTYIQQLDPQASSVFYALRAGQSLPFIEQQTGLSQARVEQLCQSIVAALCQRNRLYLLDSPVTESLTHESQDSEHNTANQRDIASVDNTVLKKDEYQHLKKGWDQLDAIQQFVLEALVIQEQDAASVLQALKVMDVSIKQGVSADQTSLQQLYYFKRKTLSCLQQLLEQ